MGSGVAVLDYDIDGKLDLFFTNGAFLKDPMPREQAPDKSAPKYWNRLYQQKTDGTFVDVTERAGVKGNSYSMGAATADYDNDGYVDLLVTGYGANQLYHNNGDGTFSDVSHKLPVNSGWSTSAGWFDYDRDGRLDLFLVRTLLHQKSDGAFEDVTTTARIADPAGKGLGVALADFDNDGWTDVFVANDSVRQSLYRNKGDGSFEDIAVMSGAAYDENGRTFAGMGIDCAAYDNDSN